MYLAIPFISLYFHFFLNKKTKKLDDFSDALICCLSTYLHSGVLCFLKNIVVFFFKTGRELSPDLMAGGSEKFAAKDKNETNPETKQVALIQSEQF